MALASLSPTGSAAGTDWPKEFTTVGGAKGRVLVLPRTNAIELRAVNTTLEQVLAELTELGRFRIDFYCSDPTYMTESVSRKFEAGSMQALALEALGDGYTFTFANGAGEPVSATAEAATIAARYGDCDTGAKPRRTFRLVEGHPLLHSSNGLELKDIEKVLETEGPATRRFALEILRIRGKPDGIQLAKAALDDSDPDVVVAAAKALLRMVARGRSAARNGETNERARSAAAYLARQMREKPYVELVPVLARMDAGEAWPAIDALTRSSSSQAPTVAVRALVITQDPRGIPWLESVVAGTDDAERALQAAMAIARIDTPEAARAIEALLASPNGTQQAAAAAAVSALGDTDEARSARAALDALLRRPPVEGAVLRSLTTIVYLPPMESLLSDANADETTKVNMLDALGRTGNADFADVAAKALHDPALSVRLKSVETLARMQHGRATPHLLKAARQPEASVRAAAMSGLSGVYAEPAVIGALVSGLDDSDAKVRRSSIESIAQLGEPDRELARTLERHIEHNDPYVAELAARILRVWGIR